MRTAAMLIVVGTLAASPASGDVRLLVENFPGGAFSPRFSHEILPSGGGGPNYEFRSEIPWDPPAPLPGMFMHMYPARDRITWDTSGIGNSVFEASVDVWDHNGGFAGTSTASVQFEGTFDSVTLRPGTTAGVRTLAVTSDTEGVEGRSLGPIVSITLVGAIDADFGNITVNVAHKHCACDINQDNIYSVQDIFEFLSLFFGQDEHADFNEDGEISVQDIFDFLGCWFDPAASGLFFCP